jgi:REP element-mobilizing transposase RayT
MENDNMTDSLPKRKVLPHARPGWVDEDSVFFVTINCLERGTNSLCLPDVALVLRESAEHRATKGDWHPRLMVLMPDHLHMLVTFPLHVQMKKVISDWKQYTAKRSGVRWQRDFFDHRLRSDESYVEKASYIRNNPVRKELIGDAAAWPYKWEWQW